MIVFVHVPKTGGRTLSLLASHHAGCRAWSVDSEAELGWKMTAVPQGASFDMAYIGGHFRLPYAIPLIAGRNPATRPTYVTLLRDPLERAFSLYLFVLRVTSALPDLTKAVQGRDFGYFIDYAYDNASRLRKELRSNPFPTPRINVMAEVYLGAGQPAS
jgi:hypothetical protein